MSVFTTLANRAREAVEVAQTSVDRARIERARRVAQRRHEAALADLGRRARRLALDGVIPPDRLEPELASVRAMEMQIEALQAELDELVAGPGEALAPRATSPDHDPTAGAEERSGPPAV